MYSWRWEAEEEPLRRKLVALFAVGLMVAAALPASAEEEGGDTYLALGDSVAAGTQQPLPFTSNGYTDALARQVRASYGIDNFVNLACPGDDTAEVITGEGSICYGPGGFLPPGGTSQLDAAVEYLTANPGDVDLITIVIGANDILKCDPSDPDVAVCVGEQLNVIATNLSVILTTLKTVAPDVPIVAMNYYNPNLAFWLVDPALAEAALALTAPFNGTLEAVYGAFGVPVADVESAFRTYQTGGEVPLNVRSVCTLTLMCEATDDGYVLSDYDPVTPGPQTDIHPSDKGYQQIASAHMRVIKSLGLLD